MNSTSALAALCRDAWRIWRGQYRDIVPVRIRNWIAGTGQEVVVEIGQDAVRITRNASSKVYSLADDPVAAIREAIGAATARQLFAPRIRLRLAHSSCLTRHVAIPHAARHRMSEIVRLDLASGVPMPAEDYLAAHYEDRDGAVSVIVKRRFIDNSLLLLAKAGYPVSALDVWDTDGHKPLPVNLLPARGDRKRMKQITRGMVAGAVVVFIASLWLAWYQRGEAIAQLDAAIAEARKHADRVMADAESVNALTEALITVRKRKAVQPAALAYWEEITRLLPDTSWLSNFTITGERIVMTGTSSSSPELIGTLERSPLFADVGFSSPVTFDQAMGADRFTIALTMEQTRP